MRTGLDEAVATIHIPSRRMVNAMPARVQELRPKTGDTEKITINLGYVDLGHIDLLVQEGFYSTRTDFIRTAIRNQIERHADAVSKAVIRKSVDLGLRHFSRADLEAVRDAGGMLRYSRARARLHRGGSDARTGARRDRLAYDPRRTPRHGRRQERSLRPNTVGGDHGAGVFHLTP